MLLNVEVLSRSFDRIIPRAVEFTSSFYANLSAVYPQIQPADMNLAREQKLLSALEAIVDRLHQPDALINTLREIGSQHVKHGILPTHYPVVGALLLKTLESSLATDWTAEVKQAWIDAYTAIALHLLEGSPESPQLQTAPDSMTAALTIVLRQICQAEGWKYAEVWIPEGEVLRCHPAYYMTSLQLATFIRDLDLTFRTGAGLPGRVWRSKEPEWIQKQTAIDDRAYLAEIGLKAALGVPILISGEVVAVVAFYSEQIQPPNRSLVAAIGAQTRSLIAQCR